MIISKTSPLLPLILIASLVASGCSKSETPKGKRVENLIEQSKEVASDIKESASKHVESAKEAVAKTKSDVQESLESAKSSVTETAAKISEKSSEAVANVKEKAAETQKAIDTKVAALTPARNDYNTMVELAKKSGCLTCHAVDKKVIGPAWRDVAAKYSGQKDAKTTLITSISKGSRGKWGGTMPMPANSPRVADGDIEKLAEFILSLE